MLMVIAALAPVLLIGSSSTAVATVVNGSAAPRSSTPSPSATVKLSSDVLSVLGVRAAIRAGRLSTKSTPQPSGGGLEHPLSPQECRERIGASCYGARALRTAYGLNHSGVDGRGVTVGLIMPFRNPTFVHSVRTYAKQFGLPTPHLTVLTHGRVPVADPAKPDQAIVPQEGLLDAEMALTAAPRVHLVYLQVDPALLDGGPDAFKKIAGELAWLAQRVHLSAVSFSYGYFEANYTDAFGSKTKAAAALKAQSKLIGQVARTHHVSVLSADGDTGPTGPKLDGSALYDDPTAAFLASSPYVTAVSGTELHLADDGTRIAPDTVWGEHNGDQFATGGAPSTYFPRPHYQDHVRTVVGNHRGVGDIAMVGSLASKVWMYTDTYQALNGQKPGWVHTAGTSAASPLLAGIVADAAQLAHRPLGNINPALYRMARTPAAAGIADVTVGCNGITGARRAYCARIGYDLASGIGTVGDASRFMRALAAAARNRS